MISNHHLGKAPAQNDIPMSEVVTLAPPRQTEHHPTTSPLDSTTDSIVPIREEVYSESSGGNAAAADPPFSDAATQIRSRTQAHAARVKTLWLIMKASATWVGVGIVTMVLGIGIAQATVLPHIHTCPRDATCPRSFDPNSSNVLQLLQALMSYWLRAGTLIAAFGLLKLSAYQSWFIMMRHGNTIENLDLNLGAIKGSMFDAGRLLIRKGNRWLSIFLLSQIGVSTAISLLVGLSISRDQGQRQVTFDFLSESVLPNSKASNATLNTDGQLTAIAKVIDWALNNDKSHGSALRGTLVVPDGRSNQSVDAYPDGPKISGSISCGGVDNYTTSIDKDGLVQYNITINTRDYIALQDMQLAVTMTNVGTALTHYLWASNTTGLLPNATVSSDGKMYFSFCNHTISMLNLLRDPDLGDDVQYIRPNTPFTPGCDSIDLNVCVSDSVSNAILDWWGGIGNAFWKLSCRGGVLGPVKRDADICPLTSEIWSETAISMLDGIMQTAPRMGHDTQELFAFVEHISTKRWWLQGLVPLFTLLLYLASLSYTLQLSQENPTLKELNLFEVISAAQTEHVRSLVQSGRLRKSIVRYGSDVGFVKNLQEHESLVPK